MDIAFTPGQVCTYRGAAVPSSRAIIGRVDAGLNAGRTIVSITLTDIPLPEPGTGRLVPKEASHLPVDGEALLASIVECVGKAPVSKAFEEGYATWRQAYDQGRAGVFTIPLAEIGAALAKSLSSTKSL